MRAAHALQDFARGEDPERPGQTEAGAMLLAEGLSALVFIARRLGYTPVTVPLKMEGEDEDDGSG